MSEDDYDPNTDPEIMSTPQRSIAHIITLISAGLGQLDHVGIAIEPIAMLTDPDDEIEGDYVIRVCFEVRLVDGKFFVKVFHANIRMELFIRMNEERFKRNIHALYRCAMEFQRGPKR